jgi:hypothetical protein
LFLLLQANRAVHDLRVIVLPREGALVLLALLERVENVATKHPLLELGLDEDREGLATPAILEELHQAEHSNVGRGSESGNHAIRILLDRQGPDQNDLPGKLLSLDLLVNNLVGDGHG